MAWPTKKTTLMVDNSPNTLKADLTPEDLPAIRGFWLSSKEENEAELRIVNRFSTFSHQAFFNVRKLFEGFFNPLRAIKSRTVGGLAMLVLGIPLCIAAYVGGVVKTAIDVVRGTVTKASEVLGSETYNSYEDKHFAILKRQETVEENLAAIAAYEKNPSAIENFEQTFRAPIEKYISLKKPAVESKTMLAQAGDLSNESSIAPDDSRTAALAPSEGLPPKALAVAPVPSSGYLRVNLYENYQQNFVPPLPPSLRSTPTAQ